MNEKLAAAVEAEAARLAGLSEILLAVGADADAANSLGVCRDVLDQANDRLCAIASRLRRSARAR